MDRRAALAALVVVLFAASAAPAKAFIFGALIPFFQPFPLLGIRTVFAPTQVGGIYINAFPFTTPPAGKIP